MKALCRLAAAFGALLWLDSMAAAAVDDPAVACDLLAAQHLGARGGYRPMGKTLHRCASARRPLPLGGSPTHEIRYVAEGDATRVRSLSLQLYVNSREDVQPAHRRLLEYAELLAEAAFGRALPQAAVDAILAGVNGRFAIDNGEVVAEKAYIHGRTYELFVRLRLPPGVPAGAARAGAESFAPPTGPAPRVRNSSRDAPALRYAPSDPKNVERRYQPSHPDNVQLRLTDPELATPAPGTAEERGARE